MQGRGRKVLELTPDFLDAFGHIIDTTLDPSEPPKARADRCPLNLYIKQEDCAIFEHNEKLYKQDRNVKDEDASADQPLDFDHPKVFVGRDKYPYPIQPAMEEIDIVYADVTKGDEDENNIRGYFHASLLKFEKYHSSKFDQKLSAILHNKNGGVSQMGEGKNLCRELIRSRMLPPP